MTTYVVDTNVAIVANGRDIHVDMRCQAACVGWLEHLVKGGVVAIDAAGEILEEYGRYRGRIGSPGVGDAFFKHLFDNQYDDARVRRVRVTPTDDDGRGFEELPENQFDRSDRKFLAVALTEGATVLNAADSDWAEHQGLMERIEVDVVEVCPHEIQRKLDDKFGCGIRVVGHD